MVASYPRGPRRPSRRFAFTLVELLVVIGIIALLISMLLPSLNKARQQSLTVKCASNLRQIGNAFKMYAQDYKGAFPVVKWDYPSALPYPNYNGQSIYNLYWGDFLAPYVYKPPYPTQAFLAPANSKAFESFRQSVLWGCPSWDGQFTAPATYSQNGISIYESGYLFNCFPTCDYNWPKTAGSVSLNEAAISSSDFSNPNSQQVAKVNWYRQNKWTHPADRALVTEGLLWLMYVNVQTAPLAQYPAQPILAPSSRSLLLSGPATNGFINIDRYRHGVRPKISGDYYLTKGGREAFNTLYADGHVATVPSYREGLYSVQMRRFP